MNYIFFGTPEFAATILNKLIANGFAPGKIVCNPDRPTGRKKIITPPPVKKLVIGLPPEVKNKIQILQPEKLDSTAFVRKNEKFDLFIVAAYSKIIPKEILEVPVSGAIGVHPSLLPEYRGASPIQTAILNGEKESGVTLYLLDEKIDHGPIIAQRKLNIENMFFETASEKLAELAGNLLSEILPGYLAGDLPPTPQKEAAATYTKKFSSDDGFVGEDELAGAISGKNSESAEKIEKKIRALNPEPGVWTKKENKRMKLLEAKIKDGFLILEKTQMEGERPKVPNGLPRTKT